MSDVITTERGSVITGPALDAEDLFEGQDLRTLLDACRQIHASRPFLYWEPFEGASAVVTFTDFVTRVERFAAGLHARGVRPGDRLLIHLENCPEALVAWLGCGVMGAVAVMTSPRAAPAEMSYFVELTRPVACVTQPKFQELVAAAAPDLRWMAVTETDCGAAPAGGGPERGDRFDAVQGDPADLPRRRPDRSMPFSIQFTSGTTARPKGVVWTHGNALWGGRVGAMHQALTPNDVYLVTLPINHTNAQSYSILSSLWAGNAVVLQPRFSASRFWSASLERGCTVTSAVPFCVHALLDQPVPERHDYRLWGNAVCSPPSDARLGIRTIGWWGMSETVTHGTVGHPTAANTPMSMGRASPAYRLKVLGPDGREVGPDEPGDLYIHGVRGVSLFAEYFDDPVSTQASFDHEGYLATGDRVRRDADGFFFFCDRAKDILKVGGENVSAAEIEAVIMAVSGVREVAVVGRPHPMLDEAPVAFVVPAGPQAPGLEDRIAAACANALSGFKRPHEIRLTTTLPRATLEKVAKAELRALLIREADVAAEFPKSSS
ncbi:MAG: AMP-binding protein [Brevundimonas sp.]